MNRFTRQLYHVHSIRKCQTTYRLLQNLVQAVRIETPSIISTSPSTDLEITNPGPCTTDRDDSRRGAPRHDETCARARNYAVTPTRVWQCRRVPCRSNARCRRVCCRSRYPWPCMAAVLTVSARLSSRGASAGRRSTLPRRPDGRVHRGVDVRTRPVRGRRCCPRVEACGLLPECTATRTTSDALPQRPM